MLLPVVLLPRLSLGCWTGPTCYKSVTRYVGWVMKIYVEKKRTVLCMVSFW